MSTFLPKDVEDGLRDAVIANQRRQSRLRVQNGEESYKVLKMWSNGFSVATEDAPHLRGLVDLYDAGRHLSQALIVASEVGDGEMRYEFKRSTPAADKPPVDFAEDPNAPAGLLPRL
ncbi:hypothetical protein [Donghicola sp.]|jgi:hypothetical protein|uniref:hypothetical protein n=1 Tax=Donghicola sp. TaxID=1929294 RepID=UPI0025E911E5|nr:hypothetical protein [Donghicola sp.]MCT4578044.1 hypothetical protein [Donghicola sp.]